MRTWTKRFLAVLCSAAMLMCSLYISEPQHARAATTTDVFDFNGTDFDTSVLAGEGSGPLANTATALSDTSGVPEGFADGVYAGSKNGSYISVPVDFAKPIDLAKVTSIKVRMYVNGSDISSDKLRIFAEDGTANGRYEQLDYASYGASCTWSEIDITDILNNQKLATAKDENGYLDRFIIGQRVYGNSSIIYFDSIIIEGEDYFVEAGDIYDFNGTDFSTALLAGEGNGPLASANLAKLLADTGEVPEGFIDNVYGGGSGTYASVPIDFAKPIDLSKVTSIKVRMYITEYTLSGTPKLRILSEDSTNDSNSYVETTYTDAGITFGQWCEVDLTDELNNSKIRKDENGYLDRFIIAYRVYGSTAPTVYFDHIAIVGEDYLVQQDIVEPEEPEPGITEFTEVSVGDFVDSNGNTMESKDYPYAENIVDDFRLKEHTSFEGKKLQLRMKFQYGENETRIHVAGNNTYSGLMIYPNKTGTYLFIIASQDYAGTDSFQAIEVSAANAGVASFINESFLLELSFDFGKTDSSNRADLSLGVYINENLYHGQTYTFTKCDLSKFGNYLTLYRANASSIVTVGSAKLEPDTYDFNGTDFDTTVYASEGNGVLTSGNLATKLTDTSAVATGFADGVYGGCSANYVSFPVCFPQAIDLSRVMSIKVRMYVPTELDGANSRIRIFTDEIVANATYADASYKDDMGGVYGAWYEMDITTLLKDSRITKDSNGNLGRFIIGFRTYGNYTCYFDSIIIEGFDYFVSEEGTFRDVTFSKLGQASQFNTTTNAWDIYPVPENPISVPGQEGITTFNVDCDIDGAKYEAVFTRSDNVKGLYMVIPEIHLPHDADGVVVTIQAGEYAPNGVTAGIRITEDYEIYLHKGDLTTYQGEVLCEADNGSYVVGEGDNIKIDGVPATTGQEYKVSGVHLMTYSLDGYEYAKHIILYLYGDMNDDGAVATSDLIVIKKYLANHRSITKAGAKAADMDVDDVVTAKDIKLLRQRLVTDSGALVLCPTDGRIVAHADAVAEEYVTNYYVTKADTFGIDPIACGRNVTLLKWISFENVENYTVKLATKADMTDAITYETSDCTLGLLNLLVDTDYYWTIAAGEFVSDVQSFHTQDTIRTITIDGVDNARDGGGWDTIDGKYVKQGMFYRGAKIDNITPNGIDVMLDQLGIKTDLDLRNPGEENSGASPLGTSVNYINVGGPYYWEDTRGINAKAYQEALVTEIRTFANPDNYPIYVHCSIGRDRTGTLCFLINALLGVSEQDLFMDYEFSTLSLNRSEYSSAQWLTGVFDNMYDNVKAYAPDGTMAEATEAFMLSIGVTQEEIDSIREILLEEK